MFVRSLSAFTLRTFGQEETRAVTFLGVDSADVIPNQYIVVFNETVDAATIASDLQNSRAAVGEELRPFS